MWEYDWYLITAGTFDEPQVADIGIEGIQGQNG